MKITACNVGKRSIISFVIFSFLLISVWFYLTQPLDAFTTIDYISHSDVDFLSNLALTETQTAFNISNADNSAYINMKNISEMPVLCKGIVSASTAGAAYIFETCALDATGIISNPQETDTGKVVFNETNKK